MSSRVVKILRKQIPVLIQAMKSNGRANTLVKKLERNNCKEELDVPNTGMYVSQKLETTRNDSHTKDDKYLCFIFSNKIF